MWKYAMLVYFKNLRILAQFVGFYSYIDYLGAIIVYDNISFILTTIDAYQADYSFAKKLLYVIIFLLED